MTTWLQRFLVIMVVLVLAPVEALAQNSNVRPPDNAVQNQTPEGEIPAHLMPSGSDSDFWRQIREGAAGQVSLPNAEAGLMIQSEGDNWRNLKEGNYAQYTAYGILGMIGLLAVFFVLRGRVRISHGRSDRTIVRFIGIERFAHWLTAVSFIILAITGLNLIFGRELIPLLDGLLGDSTGKAVYAQITMWGKIAHNSVGFAFMAGIILMFVMWVWHNIPNHHDLIWFARGGGILGGAHPPAKKFNGGQKIIFWLTILGGGSLAASGIALIWPFQFEMFNGTFALVNSWAGTELPTDLSPIQEMQLMTLWHGIVAGVMIAVILAHIYIGSMGMEGAFAAMGSGRVDRNWAKDHHSLWVDKVEKGQAAKTPAE